MYVCVYGPRGGICTYVFLSLCMSMSLKPLPGPQGGEGGPSPLGGGKGWPACPCPIYIYICIYTYIYISRFFLLFLSPISQVECTPKWWGQPILLRGWISRGKICVIPWICLIQLNSENSLKGKYTRFLGDIWSFRCHVDFPKNKSSELMTYEFEWFCWSNTFFLLVIQRYQLVPPTRPRTPPATSWFTNSTSYRYLQILNDLPQTRVMLWTNLA